MIVHTSTTFFYIGTFIHILVLHFMPLTIVVGGQYGGEGKGLITAHIAQNAEILVKIGGPNSAHSFGVDGQMFRVRMIPSGANIGPKGIVFPAGCLIHVDTLFEEIEILGYSGRIYVDYNAGIVDDETVKLQQADEFYENVGSTLTGTGHASSRRALRRLNLAKNEPRLKQYLTDTASLLQDALRSQLNVVAEGAQAYGLSNYHGNYPFVSSRDTTAGSVLAQMGIGPKAVDNIILVVKCFPTRNVGGEGHLAHELSKDYVLRNKDCLLEKGGGTYGGSDSQRRVGLFDFGLVNKACFANTPTMIALTGVDRLSGMLHDESVANHYGTAEEFIARLESRYGVPVSIYSNGPYISDIVDRRNYDRTASND